MSRLRRNIETPSSHLRALHRTPIRQFALLMVFVAFSFSTGCNRSWYRQQADDDAYHLLQTRQTNPLWQLPLRPVEPDQRSRLSDANSPDCGPKPLDDAAANKYMREPYCYDNTKYWDAIPTDPYVDSFNWMKYLPVGSEGDVMLSRDTAVELALLHNRDFQTQVERIYLAALALSQNRFEFDVNWFGGTSTNFQAQGEAPTATRRLNESTRIGLIKSLAAGGELAATLANSFVWELGGNGSNFTASSGSLVISLTQPLLRGAFRHVRLESLTQSERNLLYEVRDFARFRRQFYLDITSGYLALLNQLQSLRNQRANLESLELNLAEHEELFARQLVSQLRVDQVFQNYQSGRISLLGTEQSYQNALDQFKFQLGLPASVEFKLDESLLKPFQLNDPELDQLQDNAQAAYQELIQTLPPEEIPVREDLVAIHQELRHLQDVAATFLPEIKAELDAWKEKLAEGPDDLAESEEKLDHQQQESLAGRVEELLQSVEADLTRDIENAEKWDVDDPIGNRRFLDMPLASQEEDPSTLTIDDKMILSWHQLSRQLGIRLRERIANLFIAQVQIRLFQIEVTPFRIAQEQAVQMALECRLDLMNQRGNLTDAYRQVEVAADNLQSDLNVSATANLGTDQNRAFRFDSSENSYQVGVEFDGPLNRQSERNGYRASQLAYQAARRNYMAVEDSIVNQIRADIRALKISRLNFQISRQQLIAATRQVDEAQFQLRTALDGGDSSLTQDLLDALQGLLGAKNDLISNWISYEIARIRLFVDLELLYLDDNGQWINEQYNPNTQTPVVGQGEFSSDAIESTPPSPSTEEQPPTDSSAGLNENEWFELR